MRDVFCALVLGNWKTRRGEPGTQIANYAVSDDTRDPPYAERVRRAPSPPRAKRAPTYEHARHSARLAMPDWRAFCWLGCPRTSKAVCAVRTRVFDSRFCCVTRSPRPSHCGSAVRAYPPSLPRCCSSTCCAFERTRAGAGHHTHLTEKQVGKVPRSWARTGPWINAGARRIARCGAHGLAADVSRLGRSQQLDDTDQEQWNRNPRRCKRVDGGSKVHGFSPVPLGGD